MKTETVTLITLVENFRKIILSGELFFQKTFLREASIKKENTLYGYLSSDRAVSNAEISIIGKLKLKLGEGRGDQILTIAHRCEKNSVYIKEN